MKACIIQPPYSRDIAFSDEYFQYKISMPEPVASGWHHVKTDFIPVYERS